MIFFLNILVHLRDTEVLFALIFFRTEIGGTSYHDKRRKSTRYWLLVKTLTICTRFPPINRVFELSGYYIRLTPIMNGHGLLLNLSILAHENEVQWYISSKLHILHITTEKLIVFCHFYVITMVYFYSTVKCRRNWILEHHHQEENENRWTNKTFT